MLIDAHAHLDQYDAELLPQVLQEIERLQVFTMSVAMDPPSYTRTCALAAAHPWIPYGAKNAAEAILAL